MPCGDIVSSHATDNRELANDRGCPGHGGQLSHVPLDPIDVRLYRVAAIQLEYPSSRVSCAAGHERDP